MDWLYVGTVVCMTAQHTLLVATRNPGKLREYITLLDMPGLPVCSLDDVGITTDIEETGNTYEENARLKARGYMQASGLPTMADDSGLEVAVLDGAPGLYSARYGGVTGRAQVDYLLEQLEGVPLHERMARFVVVIVLVHPNGREEVIEAKLPGVIEFEPRGTGGFGYDSVFYVLDEDKTMAELTPEQKNAISHRGKAMREVHTILERWQAEGLLG
jgi:XTP/dITP diphosphohydrolase